MAQLAIMNGSCSFRLIDKRSSMLFRNYTHLPFLISSATFHTLRNNSKITLLHSNHVDHATSMQCSIKLQLWNGSRCMSSKRDPPDLSDIPNPYERPKDKTVGLGNMMNYVKEKSSGFQAFSKQLSERSPSQTSTTAVASVNVSERDTKPKDEKKTEDWNDIFKRWYIKYQDFIGITSLQNAQNRVTELSEGLLDTQSRRRHLQAELEDLQEQLTINHQRITKTELYSEEHYRLFDEARDKNTRLKEVRTEFDSCERLERDTFSQLSAAIRDCHERERTQAEQSKYWSIIASVVSAGLASVITSFNNWVRIREIKDHVSLNNQSLLEGYQKMHEDIVGVINTTIANSATTAATTNENGEALQPNEVIVSEDDNFQSPSIVTVENDDFETAPNVVVEHEDYESPQHISISSARLVEEDVLLLSQAFADVLKEKISDVVSSESKQIQETMKPHFDAIYANLGLLLEGNKALAETIVESGEDGESKESIREVGKMEVISPTLPDESVLNEDVKTVVVVDHSYKHIASAMAVGAGIGTLATAFFLGSFTGGATG